MKRFVPVTFVVVGLIACGTSAESIGPGDAPDAGTTPASDDAGAPPDAAPIDVAEAGTDASTPDADADAGPPCNDLDGDGYGVGAGCVKVDCDDTNPLVNPGMQELADDGLDNDCSGGDLVAATGPGHYVNNQSASCSDSDAARGTKAVPYCTIEKAVLDSYQVFPDSVAGEAFFVAKGSYTEVIGMPKSIRLYGGYDGTTWAWDPTQNETVIGGVDKLEDSDSRACRTGPGCSAQCVCIDWDGWVSINVAANVVMSGFTIKGGVRSGKPLFGVTVNSSGKVTLAHDRITGGTGIQNVVVQIPPSATDVRLLYDHITGGTPQSLTVFGVNNLGYATLYGNVIAMGPGAATSYGAAVQNYGEMRLAANVLNPGDQGANVDDSYGLVNLVANGVTKGTAYAVNNVIFAGRGKKSSRGVLSNSPLTLANNVIGDRTPVPLDWALRPTGSAIPLDVGFASKTWLRNNVLANLIYTGEPSPPNALANRHLFVHSAQSATYVDAIATVNACSWTGCQSTGDNLALFPAFVDPTSDFHLPGGSPLAGKGTPTGPWITGGLGHLDIDAQLRPLGGAWDIGVDEVN